MDLDIVPRTPDTQNQQMLQRLRKNLHSDFDNVMDTEENTTMKQIEDHIGQKPDNDEDEFDVPDEESNINNADNKSNGRALSNQN